MIEILLVENVEQLGKRGQRVKVRPGYARNYLLPMGIAVPVTPDNIARVEKRRVQWLAEEAKLLEAMRELAAHVAKLDLKLVEKASEAGSLYGSVTEKMIADAASAQGIELKAKQVRLAEPIKLVGDYEVTIRLHEEVSVEVPVKVRAEGREDWVPGQEEADETADETAAEDESSPEDAPARAE